MTVEYKITEDLHKGYAILRVDGRIITWVKTNIKTREKAERAKEIWEKLEATRGAEEA